LPRLPWGRCVDFPWLVPTVARTLGGFPVFLGSGLADFWFFAPFSLQVFQMGPLLWVCEGQSMPPPPPTLKATCSFFFFLFPFDNFRQSGRRQSQFSLCGLQGSIICYGPTGLPLKAKSFYFFESVLSVYIDSLLFLTEMGSLGWLCSSPRFGEKLFWLNKVTPPPQHPKNLAVEVPPRVGYCRGDCLRSLFVVPGPTVLKSGLRFFFRFAPRFACRPRNSSSK